MKRWIGRVALLMILLSPVFLQASVRLPAIFSDGMVLQRKSSCTVWGWADPGEQITVTGNWNNRPISVSTPASGKWELVLPTGEAGGPYMISIAGTNTIQLKEILLGEVWVCSGQSNMVFSLKSDIDARTEIPKANYPTIRYFSVKRQYGLEPFADCPGSTWQTTTPATAGSFSAIAYYFATRLQKELNVPVGIIYAAWGGTPAEAWTPGPVLQSKPLLANYFDRWKAIQDNVGADTVAYFSKMEEWTKDSTRIKKPAEPQTYYYFKRPWREPSVLFNGMIHPVIPYSIKGVLWYQGESNVAFANEYFELFSNMIRGWRSYWDKEKMPFYFVQLAPYGYSDMDAAAQVREAQEQVADNVPHTGMVVTVDDGDMKDIHFTRKSNIGNRLAILSLVKNYGRKNLTYQGPLVKRAKIRNGQVHIEYRKSSMTSNNQPLLGFEIGYKDPGSDSIIYVEAQAKIENNKVIVWHETITQPVEVRYAWLLPGKANLFNQEGFPAYPFRKNFNSFMDNRFSLQDKVIVVTGATGVLGHSFITALAGAGASVGILGRNEKVANERADEIQKNGGQSIALVADVLDQQQLINAKNQVIEKFGKIDGLVNGAGGNMPEATLQPGADIFALDMDSLQRVMNLNLFGTLLPVQVFGEAIVTTSGKGSIVNISSVAAHTAVTRVLGYSMAKTAIEAYTKWFAVELANRYADKLRMNAVVPGFFIAEQNRKLLTNEDGTYTDRGQKVIGQTPFKRFGQPDELAGALIWLLSDASSFVNGSSVKVDGGFTVFSGV